MQTVQNGYRSLSLLMDLNWDRALCAATLTLSLGAGASLAAMIG